MRLLTFFIDLLASQFLFHVKKLKGFTDDLLELQRQELSYQEANSKYIENLRQQEFRKASINTQIATVEEKLGSLVAVTSPFDGKIRKINYESQNNNYILVI